MNVFVVILNYNGKDFLLNCLDSVEKLKTDNFDLQVIVVDNASTDGSDKIVEQKYKDIKILRNKENLGFTEGNNVGIRYSLENGADYIFLLNPDTTVSSDLLVQLIKQAESDQMIGLVGPKIYFAPGYEFHKDRYKNEEKGKVIWYAGGIVDWDNVLASHHGVDEVDCGQYDKVSETDFVSGCGMLIKKEVFEKIGLLDKKYFLYWEDNDFSQKAKRAGFKLCFAPQAMMVHLNASSSGSGSPLQDYFNTRNRLLFGFRYAPLRAKFALFRESLKHLLTGRYWQKRGVLDFYLRKFEKGSFVK
ncbi:MAG: glycosyltransferase family 2 protein [bacterium]|nr:glycosyltransferase family 2 protein [bacterium]